MHSLAGWLAQKRCPSFFLFKQVSNGPRWQFTTYLVSGWEFIPVQCPSLNLGRTPYLPYIPLGKISTVSYVSLSTETKLNPLLSDSAPQRLSLMNLYTPKLTFSFQLSALKDTTYD